MAKFIVLLAALALAQASSLNRAGGWGPAPTTAPPPPPTTTPGWSPPETEAPPPPPPPPPPASVTIGVNGELGAAGSGWAAENHADSVSVTGAGGWGPPANLLVSSGGDTDLAQDSQFQHGTIDGSHGSGLITAHVSQTANADESLAVVATGLDALVGQSGWVGVAGSGSSGASGSNTVVVP